MAAFEKSVDIIDDIQKGKAIENLSTFKVSGNDHQAETAKFLDKKFEGVA